MTEPVTILAVDDQPANLRLLDAVLSPRGYRVITASSGEQALELLPRRVSTWCSSTSSCRASTGTRCADGSAAPRLRFFGGDDHCERTPGEDRPSKAAQTTSSASRSIRASRWPGWPRWLGSSGTTTPSPAGG